MNRTQKFGLIMFFAAVMAPVVIERFEDLYHHIKAQPETPESRAARLAQKVIRKKIDSNEYLNDASSDRMLLDYEFAKIVARLYE